MENKVHTIFSGGQSGADLNGNRFAQLMQIETYINTCRGFKPIDKADWDYFNSLERKEITPLEGIPGLVFRNHYNVKHSDATLIFVARPIQDTRGSKRTLQNCLDMKKAHRVVKLYNFDHDMEIRGIYSFLRSYKPRKLNIAGERDLFGKDAAMIYFLEQAW